MIRMVVVVKVGDRVMGSVFSEAALNDFAQTAHRTPTVLVHGGGDTVTSIAEKLGVPQKFVTSPEGFRSRYTDAETIQVFTMVMAGKINKEIVRHLESRKIPAVGLSGLDGALIRAERKRKLVIRDERGRKRVIDGGYTGRVTNVDSSLLRTLITSGYVPVIAPIALGSDSEPLNLDGDRTAAYVAGALQADLLILLTDVEGVLDSNKKLISSLNAKETSSAIKKGIIVGGMIPKVECCLDAIKNGVGKAHIVDGRIKHAILLEIFTDKGIGTEIVKG